VEIESLCVFLLGMRQIIYRSFNQVHHIDANDDLTVSDVRVLFRLMNLRLNSLTFNGVECTQNLGYYHPDDPFIADVTRSVTVYQVGNDSCPTDEYGDKSIVGIFDDDDFITSVKKQIADQRNVPYHSIALFSENVALNSCKRIMDYCSEDSLVVSILNRTESCGVFPAW